MNNNLYIPPHDLQAERAVIGGLVLLSDHNNDSFQKTINTVKDGAFYSRAHRLIYQTLKKVAESDGVVDLITLTNKLERDGHLEACGGFIYVAELMRETPGTANLNNYARLVKESAIERYSVSKMQSLIAEFSDQTNGDIYQRLGMLETTITEISNLSMKNDDGGLKHISESLGKWLDNIEQIQIDGYDKNALSTGIESLDDILGIKKMRRGSLVAVGARPKMGKTAFMLLVGNHIGLDLKLPVANFSMEMPDEEIAERGISTRATVDPAVYYKKNVTPEHQGRLDSVFNEYINSNVYIDDGSALTLAHIKKECRKLRREKGDLGAIFVDYLTLMTAEKAERNDLGYGLITKGLKNLAKELKCPVVLLTQLNRNLENRPDKRPVPSDSRDTGQIEQDCDLWIGLYKHSVYDKETFYPNLVEILVRLNRHGGSGIAFAEMKEGFMVPVSTQEGQRIINQRDMIKSEKSETKKYSFKRDN